jgi:hypothetical protein
MLRLLHSIIFIFLLFTLACGPKEGAQTPDSGAFTVTLLVDDLVPAQSKTWNWDCNIQTGNNCEWRHVINNSPTHTFTIEPWV